MKTALRKFGDRGETVAENYLHGKGYEILEKNWTCREGELDLVTREKDGKVVFVEVKTRKNLNYGSGAEAVDERKLAKIICTGQKYIFAKNLPENTFWRVDVIEVGEQNGTLQVISHIQNVTI